MRIVRILGGIIVLGSLLALPFCWSSMAMVSWTSGIGPIWISQDVFVHDSYYIRFPLFFPLGLLLIAGVILTLFPKRGKLRDS